VSEELTVAEIAGRLKGEWEGDGEARIRSVAGVREAESGDLTFVADARYAGAAAETRASAVIVRRDWQAACPAALIRVAQPGAAFAEAVGWFAPAPVRFEPGTHATAVVAPDARIGEGVTVGPYCVVEPGVSVGAHTVLGAFCYLGHGVRIGCDCRLHPHVSVREYCRIGDRALIHNGAVIGSDGFGFMEEGGRREKVPQTGIVVIGDDVEIGANTTIDRARFGRTRIGDGVKLDNLVQVAHNVVLGDHTVAAAQTGFAGSAIIGAQSMFGGQAGVSGHITIGERVVVGAQAGVTKSVAPDSFVSGYPATSHDKARKIHAHVMRLPALKARVAELEARIKALEGTG